MHFMKQQRWQLLLVGGEISGEISGENFQAAAGEHMWFYLTSHLTAQRPQNTDRHDTTQCLK
jgi:hypothetical protein